MRPLPASIAERLPSAAEAFAERGFEETRIEDLAAATGVPKATLYYYFTGKAEILSFLLSRLLNKIRQAVADAAVAAGTARQRLERVIAAQLKVMADNPAAVRALLDDFGRVGRMPEVAAALTAAFHEPVQRILADAIREGSIAMRHEDTETAAVALFGAVSMTALHYLLRDGRVPLPRIKRQMGRLVDGFWSA